MNNNYGLRRNNSSCGSANQPRFDPFMFGNNRGFGVGNGPRMPLAISVNTVSAGSPSGYPPTLAGPASSYYPPTRTASQKDTRTNIGDCFHWPASLNYNRGYQQQRPTVAPCSTRNYGTAARNTNQSSGMYCAEPPKVYMSMPGDGHGKGHQIQPQNIPCHVAPLGTDPMSLIKPLAPLTVRVQAPSDLFTGNPAEPKTIAISPAQLYGGVQ